jgi:pimeloyl-ACP methyl ester carboxylesterase
MAAQHKEIPMKTFSQLFVCAFVLLVSGCQSLQPSTTAGPTMKQALVNGVALNYVEQGQGAPVVFVHGAFSDHRNWEAQRAEIAKRYRYIALDQRYFGTAPWSDDGAKYSVPTHANDLAAFIQQLNAGPVHVVGWSYGGAVALVLAVQRPDLVRSLFLNEPALGSIVSDPADQKILAEERRGVASAVAASKANNQAQAVQIFADWVNDEPGSFEALPSTMRNVHLENSRTLPAHFASPPSPAITCPQLGQLKVPVSVAKGQQSRPFFTILADATHRCIPGSRLIVTPNARHMAPVQNTSAFNAALLAHLDGR